MFIAHAPSGYITSKLLFPRLCQESSSRKAFYLAGIVGAVAPDFDMLYFHLVDHRSHTHHSYVSHYPILWLSLLAIALVWHRLANRRNSSSLAVIFALNGLLHMLLDTVVGGIWWLAPWVNQPYYFAHVTARYHPWWLNFFLHWSFLLELALVSWAWHLSPLPKPWRRRAETLAPIRESY
jgi:inner membrane protein